MTGNCPCCHEPLDATRAPVAKIVGAKVVSFCSQECAATGVREAAPKSGPDDDTPVEKAETSEAVTSEPVVEKEEPQLAHADESEKEEDEADSLAPIAVASGAGSVSPRRKRSVIVFLAAAILLGGMAIAIIEAVSPSSSSPAQASQYAPSAAASASVAATDTKPERATPTEPTDADLRRQAIEALREQMSSQSPRVRRIAALALSRIGDASALESLAVMQGHERSELRRIEIAYGLARAGVARGREVLVASLKSKRRDARLDAASALARLGDDSGRKYLHSMLKVRSHRLGAAAVLAELEDERGLDMLRKVAADRRASQAAKLRATVALGRAKQDEARDELRRIVEDGRYQVGAAAALATLGDESVVPILAKQLEHSSVRVEAALALVALQAKVDLDPLRVALSAGDDVGTVSAAEALLILLAEVGE